MHGNHLRILVLAEELDQIIFIHVALVSHADNGRDTHPVRAAVADNGHAHTSTLT